MLKKKLIIWYLGAVKGGWKLGLSKLHMHVYCKTRTSNKISPQGGNTCKNLHIIWIVKYRAWTCFRLQLNVHIINTDKFHRRLGHVQFNTPILKKKVTVKKVQKYILTECLFNCCSFGMVHDGDGNECKKSGGKIMSATLSGNNGRFLWSACSRDYLEDFLR